jgi:hypothetical protein
MCPFACRLTFAHRNVNQRRIAADSVEVGKRRQIVPAVAVVRKHPGNRAGNDGLCHGEVRFVGDQVLEVYVHGA